MKDYQLRVVTEKEELDEKIGKLEAFLLTGQYDILPLDEREQLVQQRIYMKRYSSVLGNRIATFK